MTRLLRAAMALIVFAATAVVAQAGSPTPQPTTGFTDTIVAKNLDQPTSLAFLHNGNALLINQSGVVRLWNEGATSPTVLTNIDLPPLCAKSDAGLLGVVVNPVVNADGSEYFYLFFTVKGSDPEPNSCPHDAPERPTSPFERLSRFTIKDGQVVPGSQLIVLDHIPSRILDHTGGDMFFAQDGYLYITTGDGDLPQKSNDSDSLRGKILRINAATGDGVPGNPYFNAPNAVQCGNPQDLQYEQGKPCREVFAIGLRHPWRMALKPGTDPNNVEFYINDVGKGTWEEIDKGAVGANYGWDTREGPCLRDQVCTPGPQTAPNDPIFWYQHITDSRNEFKGCSAITGAAFVPPGVWPAEYDNDYLFGDYVCGRIWRLEPNGTGGFKDTTFVDNILRSSISAMKFGPAPDPTRAGKLTQALYYTIYSGGGELHRVTYTSNLNRAPTAELAADKTFGPNPLTVTFNGADSSDPDGDPLTYDWDFGDGTTSKDQTSSTIQHTYTLPSGTKTRAFTAQLIVRDNKGNASDAASLRIDVGNEPPVPVITSPAPDVQFAVGQTFTLSGHASDPEDGPLPDTALTWHVLRHHDTHTHEELFLTKGNNISLGATEPEGLSASKSSYFEIQLGAVDSQGLAYTVTQDLRPHLVDLTFQTEPAGLQLVADDTTINGAGTVTSWENYAFNVSTPVQQDASGQWMIFDHWADGAASHPGFMRRIPAGYWPQHEGHGEAVEPTREIVTPAQAASYTAVFKPLIVEPAATNVQASVHASTVSSVVHLSAPSTADVTVAYSTADGTAKAGVDYTAISGTLTFEPGETTATVTVPLIKNDDALGKTFSLVLSEPSGATLGTSVVTITISDIAAVPDQRRIYLPLMGR